MFKRDKQKYMKPITLKKWVNDIADGELYEAFVNDDKTVWSTSGRFAHSSGATKVSWQEFDSGKMNDLIEKTIGVSVLTEIKRFINDAST